MASIVLGCDRNGANDSKFQSDVAKVLEDAGHQVEKLSIGPNYFAKYSYSSKAKGKIGVYLLAAGITSIADAYEGNISFDYTYFGIRGDLGQSHMSSLNDFETRPISKDRHGDCKIKTCDKLVGKTFPQMNEVIKSKCRIVFGKTGSEMGSAVLSALSGSSTNTTPTNKDGDDEEWDDKDNFTPHKGRIMEILPYKSISSVSYDKSYDSPTGTAQVELLYHSKDYRFIYKGVATKLKLRRTCDNKWSATGLEEPNYDENEKFVKEHVPTKELLKELGLPYYKELRNKSTLSNTSSNISSDDNNSSDNNDSNSNNQGNNNN